MTELEAIIEKARNSKMTATEKEDQRQSFAYGNTKFENDEITRESVRRASEKLRGSNDGSEKQQDEPTSK